MKKNIHPKQVEVEVKCASCAQVHKFLTTAKDPRIDTCANCQSAYTGKDTGAQDRSGRIDKFNKRFNIKK